MNQTELNQALDAVSHVLKYVERDLQPLELDPAAKSVETARKLAEAEIAPQE